MNKKSEIVARQGEQMRKHPPKFDTDERGPPDVMYGNTKVLISGQDQKRSPVIASTTGSSSGGPRKTAPPVPRKPASLTGPSEQTLKSSSTFKQHRIPPSSAVDYEGTNPSKLSPSSRPTADNHMTQLSSQKLPTEYLARDSGKNQPDFSQTNGAQVLPQRLTGQTSVSKGLLDEDDDGAQAIPSLQPLRRS